MKKGEKRGTDLEKATREAKKYRHKIIKIVRRWNRKIKKGNN